MVHWGAVRAVGGAVGGIVVGGLASSWLLAGTASATAPPPFAARPQPGTVKVVDPNGNAKVELRIGDSAFAEVYVFGAHVTRFNTKSESHPILFLSKKAVLDGSKAIRGGIPIIFPQFGPNGPLPQHGFARTSKWKVAKHSGEDNFAEVTLTLASNEETMKIWPHQFSSSYTVRLFPDSLECVWEVENTSKKDPLTFTSALHSYFQVDDVEKITLGDLANLKYSDTTNNGQIRDSEAPLLKVKGEIDRLYINTPKQICINDKDGVIQITKDESLPDAVIWNPAPEKSKAMKDFDDSEWKQMICVEPAAVHKPVVLAPGAKWSTTMLIRKSYKSSKL
ncbi:glucose-6-phosphate 1-epimerase [Plasmodiophora brassicae]|uniref:glucose-6-phosphate 1-epimerase n=1 Tax=Plasmodiophora brassicae TaxID=37360 RepID=A0A3P3Y9F6_PLABS|nr:unnamed protein product [Plasmodiophora brassicae]